MKRVWKLTQIYNSEFCFRETYLVLAEALEECALNLILNLIYYVYRNW